MKKEDEVIKIPKVTNFAIHTNPVTAYDFTNVKKSFISERFFSKKIINFFKELNEENKKFEMKIGGRGQTNMKIFKVKVTFIDNKEKIEIVSAENELLAIDQVMEKYHEKKEILDIKIV